MGVSTYEYDVPTKVSPDKLFRGLVLNSSAVFPEVYPQVYKKLENISGDGGPGTIKKAHLAGGHQVNHIEELDTDKLEFGYTIVEGDVLQSGVEKIYNHIKIVEGPDGGSVIKNTAKYFTEDGLEFKEDETRNYAIASTDKYTGLYKAVENYLLENPHLYN
ncbi:hypothetical protein FNV43_RR21157 [Rhamnella rubrinervis]|uniref:Bet v I/Major latex protein domain-containing protein n=1 Tax=Rhamnella rubrinervis TaxID=2594499 RepID=A0A8K0DW65_9ROSA|nr:hypothetical protein FNV43_RR21157 [Rhamnella rubrinervis]